jgi:hypothetical protein
MQLAEGKSDNHQGVGRTHCGNWRPIFALAHRLCLDSRLTALSSAGRPSPLNGRATTRFRSQRSRQRAIDNAAASQILARHQCRADTLGFLRVAASSNNSFEADGCAAAQFQR